MSYSQPFNESTAQNPWANQSTNGPRFGNAYEDDNITNWTGGMPSSSAYQQPPQPRMESNKTEYVSSPSPSPGQTNPYQYTGTRLGQQDLYGSGNAYSGGSAGSPHTSQQQSQQANKIDNALPPPWDERRMHPSKWRLLLRFILLVAAVGHLGFAAGASPKSGQPVPLDSSACFYYLFAVAILTILYCIYHVGYYFFRRFAHGLKMKRPIMLAVDVVLAVMWGVGVIIEAAKYKCPPGAHDGWCDFYNVSIFFGFLCFVGFLVAVGWDVVGGCTTHKR